MAHWKSIVTISWKFESNQSEEQSLEEAKAQLDKILQINPHYEGFCVQVDVAKMKDRKRLIHVGSFSLDEVMPYVTTENIKHGFQIGGKTYFVRMNSDRYQVFKDNPSCVACGLTGSKMILDLNPGDHSPHFNMYAEENGRLVLMTKDHYLAVANGGKDHPENYFTCCSICNNLKADKFLTYDQVRQLREIHNNKDCRFSKKELIDLIENKREQMQKQNLGKL